ncbi:DNA polymerase III subunit gamma and tau [Nocardia sp. NPDC046473]|uniref:DNA polymerase III subunit gamma and tau n=1 Tax=Nocardia sp. NPDC046473 TaxID=3155733 RepID=UPI0033C82D94
MALYRKYRPATFAEVVGQEHVTDPLSIALDTGRISHAYLFSGPRGCGKTSSARILARSLNCVQGPTSTPCGVCPSCVALGPGGPGNLDVIELDAASHGGVDDTRELRDRAFYAPAESRYRVFIVDEAHMVTTAGFNALLKIVEEPPAHLIFIFATTEPDKVLPTIRSRTHHYPFRLLPPATMRGLLGKICDQEQVTVEEAVYPLVIRAGGGSPRDSLSVLDQLLAGAGPEGVTYSRAVSLLGVTDVALIDDAVGALSDNDGAELFGTVDRVMEAGHDPRRFAVDLLERLRDLILMRAVPDAIQRGLVSGPEDVLDRMSEQAGRLGPATLARYAELLHEALGEMRGATSPRLLLEVVCARMLLPSVSDAESATLQRLERLERGFAGGVVAAAPVAASGSAPAAAAPAAAAPRVAPATTSGESTRRRGAEALAAIRRETAGSGGAAADSAGAGGAPGSRGETAEAAAASVPLTDSRTESSASTAGAPSAGDAGAARSAHEAAGTRPADMSTGSGAAPIGHQAAAAPPADTSTGSSASVPEAAAEAARSGDVAGARPADNSTGSSAADATAEGGVPPARDHDQAGEAGRTRPDISDTGVQVGADPNAAASVVGPSASVDQSSGSASAESAPRSTGTVPEQVPAGSSSQVPTADASEVQAAQEFSPAEPVGGEVAEQASAGAGRTTAAQPEPVAAAASPDEAVHSDPVAEPELSAPAGSNADLLREVEGAWADIRAKVREFGAAVQAMLAGASVSRIEGDTIVFTHQHAPLAQRLSDPRNLDAVRSAVHAVLGREHDVRWEAGGAAARPAATQRAGAAAKPQRSAAQPAGRESGNAAGRASDAPAPPRFSRPSQAKNAAADQSAGANKPRSFGGDDDIPPPDFPDLPDDPGPFDSAPPESAQSQVGNGTGGGVGRAADGAVPETTPEDEEEMIRAAAVPVAPEDRRDPDEAALELLKSELGATRLSG